MANYMLTNETYRKNLEGRVSIKGKFLYVNKQKLYIKGVTYGTFAPTVDGFQYPQKLTIEKDFSLMAQNGITCVRTYTVPPKYLLDIALQYNLKVMVGLPWEQHITFLDTEERKKDIVKRVKEGAAACGQHPAILCFAIGNEIPAPIVRWYGKQKIEDFLKQLYKAVKATDPECLVTYVNFPTTEYLDLSFLDFDCFNVYLETPEKLGSYISRLHNLSGDRPLVLAEIGLDSIRNGEALQAETLKWQIKTVFAKGCAGMFVFAWTDEWWRGGSSIDDWDFGIVDRERRSKPALSAVRETMAEVPFSNENMPLPLISVVVCSFNGASTIKECMEGLQKLNYPAYEVIVVNDGSTDNLAEIVKEYPVKLINTVNCGLSSARNTGSHQANGEIIAYIDDDAYPDPHWLNYLAYAFLDSNHAGIGGPNIAPADDGPIAKCVANAPGGPVHVLITDEIAEHIPGCNMAFKKDVLLAVGGFDNIYRAAGDDVDICWKIQKAGFTIGFHPSAVVWHHRRNSFKAYWKQQKGYGKAEALLEDKWPEKYNQFGHVAWSGRIYGNGFTMPINLKKGKVFYGSWGSALFQSVYQPAHGFLNAIPLMPEWYLFSALLAFFASLGFLWAPLLWIWPIFVLSIIIVFVQAIISASENVSDQLAQSRNYKHTALITLLHLLQPMARLYGRLKHGLRPWREINIVSNMKFAFILNPQILTLWSEEWIAAEVWLERIEKELINLKTRVQRGNNFDRWDLQARNSMFSTSRGLLVIEEHGAGKQLLRFKIWPSIPKIVIVAVVTLTIIAVFAAINHAVTVSVILSIIVLLIAAEYFKDSASTMYDLYTAFTGLEKSETQSDSILQFAEDIDEKNLVVEENVTSK
ncbi:glycosyltransferase [uncultured Mucilaginibacter sp.]|uniref:glycosyltransferase n=1 Tax=uncultured Mucilaginibacter sp. TaxID=797541 RepID=UPI00260B09AF|nr:glycosyltransferase [uncultured Mucilaginibacter sp.]